VPGVLSIIAFAGIAVSAVIAATRGDVLCVLRETIKSGIRT
jgi:hypothetical protein